MNIKSRKILKSERKSFQFSDEENTPFFQFVVAVQHCNFSIFSIWFTLEWAYRKLVFVVIYYLFAQAKWKIYILNSKVNPNENIASRHGDSPERA